MKKVMFIGAAMLLGMMTINTVSAQTPEQRAEMEKLRGERMINQAKHNVKATCYDDDEYMAEIGYADNMATRDLAQKNALANCQRALKSRLEQVVKGVLQDFSSRAELSSGANITDGELRELNQGFTSVIDKSIKHTIKCYSDVIKNDKGTFDGEYNAKIAIEEFVKECEDVVENDAKLAAKVNLKEFKKSFKDNFEENKKEE